jgi:hypothetical protein
VVLPGFSPPIWGRRKDSNLYLQNKKKNALFQSRGFFPCDKDDPWTANKPAIQAQEAFQFRKPGHQERIAGPAEWQPTITVFIKNLQTSRPEPPLPGRIRAAVEDGAATFSLQKIML